MVSLNDFLIQFLQPYFFYSLVFASISFVCVKVFLRFNPVISTRKQSIIWLIPLFVPVSLLTFFSPQTMISVPSFLPNPILFKVSSSISVPPFLPNPILFKVSSSISVSTSPGIILGFPLPHAGVLSITGLLCLGGTIAAVGYLIITAVFGKTIALKLFHVVMMSPDEYAPLQEKVREISQKIGVSAPKSGLIEDLRPNAFTVGYGRHTTIVFSLGILKMLNTDELAAVVSHELAHVKARDYLFRSTSYTLNILSFFNPFSYLAASEAQRKRELLADEKGAAMLSQPSLMANVLTKLEKALQMYPKGRLAGRLSANLFLVSSIARKSQMLAAHPQIAHRVHNIGAITSKRAQTRHKTASLALLAILVFTAVLSGYSIVQIQKSFFQDNILIVTHPAINNQSVTPPLPFGNGIPLLADPNSLPSAIIFPSLQESGDLSTENGPLILNGSVATIINNASGTKYK